MSLQFQGKGEPLQDAQVQAAAKDLGGNLPSLWALMTVETRGFGFLPDRRPKILFERHVFHRLTKGAYDHRPDISSPTAGGYLGGSAEYDRLASAAKFNLEAAMESASWGLGQVMGYHAKRLQYGNVAAMAQAFSESESQQLGGLVRFINSDDALSTAFKARNWRKVAFYYNGASYAKNEYDAKLEHYHARYTQLGCPDVAGREAQALLNYLGYDTRGIDGLWGDNSKKAAIQFQRKQGLPESGLADPATIAALRKAAIV
jgi:hypothetical protein